MFSKTRKRINIKHREESLVYFSARILTFGNRKDLGKFLLGNGNTYYLSKGKDAEYCPVLLLMLTLFTRCNKERDLVRGDLHLSVLQDGGRGRTMCKKDTLIWNECSGDKHVAKAKLCFFAAVWVMPSSFPAQEYVRTHSKFCLLFEGLIKHCSPTYATPVLVPIEGENILVCFGDFCYRLTESIYGGFLSDINQQKSATLST